MKPAVLALPGVLWAVTLFAAEPAQTVKTVRLDPRDLGQTFEGIGACSAGASSRLLIEYPEPFRSQVLDFLFRPKFGASFQHLKVEIGGDVNSTDGCEPSHQHERGDLNFHRGYEWWLMKEARRRNPAIFLEALEWGAPAWIGNGYFFSQDNADYIVNFLRGARRVHGLDIQYVGVWNETRADMGWIKRFRRTLDRNRLGHVQIVATDDTVNKWYIADVLKTDPELNRAVQVIGAHYPKFQSTPNARASGKPIWSSEDGPWKGHWPAGMELARMYNRNYIQGRMTKTIIWSPVTSYYDNLPIPSSGVMRANRPWSGHYEVQPALWATAHTTQFAAPGWRYLDGACALLSAGGSVVALLAPNHSDYSLIIETTDAKSAQELRWEVLGGLPTLPLHVWRSTTDAQFEQLPDLPAAGRSYTLPLPTGAIFSVTTTTGQQKAPATLPPDRPFPLPYFETFEGCAVGATPRYFADQAGIFEVAKRGAGGGQCLRQVVRTKGIEWPFHLNPWPETFLGETNWVNYEVRVDTLLEPREGFVSLFGRVGTIPQKAEPPNAYWLKVDQAGCWELGVAKAVLASGHSDFRGGRWQNLGLKFAGEQITVLINHRPVGQLSDTNYPAGMVGFGCGWHPARFDNLAITEGAIRK